MNQLAGYPRDGVNIGEGRHADVVMGRTLRHAEVIRHPTRTEWAHIVDSVVLSLEGRTTRVDGTNERISTQSAAELDATWTPPEEVL